ncbi:hypothetical protein ACFPT7_04295 [Acidicapsa dinghuensis]|uniref:Uncharacterized protein n=1 Tax=Acidicapsa dinghuensis TaxID=2218256 RepID=A0ABW1EB37_9BACT|nr:hypothetical protein [Acidicapsa dinghuensis]
MAISRILEAIDTYIAELVSARELLAKSIEAASEQEHERQGYESSQKKRRAPMKQIAAPTTASAPVSVKIIPPKERRGRGARQKSHLRESGALGVSTPRSPVVVRAAEVAEQKAKIHGVRSNDRPKDLPADSLQGLAREVARRLGR